MLKRTKILTLIGAGLILSGSGVGVGVALKTNSFDLAADFANKQQTDQEDHQQQLNPQQHSKNEPIYYNNQLYENPDVAADQYLITNPIMRKYFIGDLEKSTSNKNTGRINSDTDALQEYNPDNLEFAYIALNQEEGFSFDYETAKKGQFPIYQRQIRYNDYSGNPLNQLPLTYEAAKKNIKQSFNQTNPIAYYKVIDINNKVQRINPLNEYDVAQLKKIAKANAEAKEKGDNGMGFNLLTTVKLFMKVKKFLIIEKNNFWIT